MNQYCGRFAPTPSGPLHFGSMLAAIGSYCDARANGGAWHIRIDDCDKPRVVQGAADDILRTLDAFALDWDGEPVIQSRNSDAHHAAVHSLLRIKRVFACACSRKEVSKAGGAGIEGPIYPGTCRTGMKPGRRARSLRLRVDKDVTVEFIDLLQGSIAQNLALDVGDFVIYRSDGIFSYHLACAVDDAQQGITHVVRGADLIDSTPRQIHLQQLLGLPTPAYLHLPVATRDGQKLSKQSLAASVDPSQPGPVIRTVLEFLGQMPPSELSRAPAKTAIAWAVRNWRRESLPARHSIEVNSQI